MIRTVLFDVGGTLEEAVHSRKTRMNCSIKILEYMKMQGIELDFSPEEFMEILEKGNKAYKENRHEREFMPYEVWSEWKLKGIPIEQDKLRAISEEYHISGKIHIMRDF